MLKVVAKNTAEPNTDFRSNKGTQYRRAKVLPAHPAMASASASTIAALTTCCLCKPGSSNNTPKAKGKSAMPQLSPRLTINQR